MTKRISFDSLTLVSNKVALPADFVDYHEGFRSPISYSLVKDATNTSFTITVGYYRLHTGLHRTSYVRIAMFRLPLEGVESVSTKCPTCKKPTENEYVNITPVVDSAEAPTGEEAMDLLRLTKRLVLCTECGTLRLIN